MTRERMIRKQLYILPAQEMQLKEKAATYGISEGEVVRKALARFLTAPPITDAMGVSFLDASRWEDEREYITTRWAELGATGDSDLVTTDGLRTWKRDDLHVR